MPLLLSSHRSYLWNSSNQFRALFGPIKVAINDLTDKLVEITGVIVCQEPLNKNRESHKPERVPAMILLSHDELSSNDIVSHCVSHQFGIALRIKYLHHAVLVEGHRSGRHMKDVPNLLHDFAFS
jgi:hypothetical protein